MAKRVLIAEDNPQSLELMRELVQADGHEVIAVTNGRDAITVARLERPDLILTDIQLPDIDGLTVTRTLKRDPSTEAIPIIGISAHALQEDVERAIQAGCVAYVSKPLDVHGLRGLLAWLLGNPSSRSAVRRGGWEGEGEGGRRR